MINQTIVLVFRITKKDLRGDSGVIFLVFGMVWSTLPKIKQKPAQAKDLYQTNCIEIKNWLEFG